MGAHVDKPKRGCIATPIYIHVVYLYATRAFVTHHQLAFGASQPCLEPVLSHENPTQMRILAGRSSQAHRTKPASQKPKPKAACNDSMPCLPKACEPA